MRLANSPTIDVDDLVSDMYLAPGRRDSDDNLKLVSNRLLLADCDQFALLGLYRHVLRGKRLVDDETNPLCDILKLSGVVKVEQGYLKVRNEIYRRVFDYAWVEKHLPGVEVRRQKEAFRRGQVRAFVFSGAALTVVGSLALFAFRRQISPGIMRTLPARKPNGQIRKPRVLTQRRSKLNARPIPPI